MSPLKRDIASADVVIRKTASHTNSTGRSSPQKKIRSCVASLQNSPNLKHIERRAMRERPHSF